MSPKRFAPLVITLIALALPGSALAATGELKGTVTGGGSPLAGVCISVSPIASGSGYFGSTDDTGAYDITGVEEGAYRVYFQSCGAGNWVSEYWNDKLAWSDADALSVTAGQATTADADLAAGAEIAGTVVDEADPTQPIGSICASAQGANYSYYSASTEPDGTYTITGLPAGDYKVRFTDCTNSGNWLAEYYDNQSSAATAQTIRVAAGEPVRGIDAALAHGGVISGTVTDSADTPAPLAGICVYADGGGGGAGFYGATTADDGSYSIRGIPAGAYDVQFYACGGGNWLSEYWNDKPDRMSADVVNVAQGSTTDGIDAQLQQGGTVSGTVTGPDGQPLQNICVSASGTLGGASALTAADGSYTITGLRTGAYKVGFDTGCMGASTGNWLAQYYNGKPDYQSADPVSVTAGANTPGIDAQMQPGGEISGTVTGAGDAPVPLAGACVRATPATSTPFFGPSYVANAARDGTYTIHGLRTGDYKLQFSETCRIFGGASDHWLAEYYDNQPDFNSGDAVHAVAGENTTGIDAELAPAGRIAGTVTDADGNPLAGVCLAVSPADGSFGGPPASTPVTAADGTYSVGGLPTGSYKVRFAPCSSTSDWLAEYWNDKPDLASADPVAVSGGQTTGGIDASLARAATISGTVTDSADPAQPLAGICVSAVPPGNPGFGFYPYATTASDGSYTLHGVATGDWNVVFSDCTNTHTWATQWYDDKLGQASANTVSAVAGDAVTGIDAHLRVGGTIAGHVTGGDPAQPLAGICVQAHENSSGIYLGTGYATTDSNGDYSITGLQTGAYTVRFYNCGNQGSNWVAQFYDNQSDVDSATPVGVTEGQATGGIDALLQLGGTIAGHVTDPNGNPLAGVCIQATDTVSGTETSTQTVGDGSYQLTALPSGSYIVGFHSCMPGGVQYGGEWYDDQVSPDQADPVVVTAGQDFTGIDASLAPEATISGHVTDTSAAPVAGVCALLFSTTDDTAPLGTSVTSSSGSYLFRGLAAGSYRVKFENCEFGPFPGSSPATYLTQWFNGKPDFASADDVTVSAGTNTQGIDAVLVEDSIVNHAPSCPDASVTTGYQAPLPLTPSCTDADSDTLTYSVVSGPAHGTVTQTDTGVTYTPDNGYSGPDSFTYKANDGQADSNTATVSVAVAARPNSAPSCGAQPSVAVEAGQPKQLTLECTDGDGDPFTLSIASGPSHGSLGSIDQATGHVTYTPAAGWTGGDSFTFKANDGGADSEPATVSLTVADTTAPETYITSGPSGTTTSSDATFAFSSSEAGSTFSCKLDDGAPEPCTSPKAYSGLAPGADHTFAVVATDSHDNADAGAATRTWHVDPASTEPVTVSGDAPAGGTVTSDPAGSGATPATPVTMAVQLPVAGSVSIQTSSALTETPPSGFTPFGQQLVIEAPQATDAANPLRLTFSVDASLLSGVDPSTVTVFRNGAAAANCTAAGTAAPDPCVESRTPLTGGDLELVVLSMHASTWNVGKKLARDTGSGGSGSGGSGSGGDSGGSTGGDTGGSTGAGDSGGSGASTPPPSGSPPQGTPAAAKCIVPKLTGLTLVNAKRALTKAHCKLGKVTKKAVRPAKGKRKPKKGTVVAQKPKAGSVKPAASKIALTLAR